MINSSDSKQTFLHWHWCLDEENYTWCFILVELSSSGQPIAAHVVPITKPFLRCSIYPFIRN